LKLNSGPKKINLRAKLARRENLFVFGIRPWRQRLAAESVGFAGGVKSPIQRDADAVLRDQAPEVRPAQSSFDRLRMSGRAAGKPSGAFSTSTGEVRAAEMIL
jgi:hypothetical protein